MSVLELFIGKGVDYLFRSLFWEVFQNSYFADHLRSAVLSHFRAMFP